MTGSAQGRLGRRHAPDERDFVLAQLIPETLEPPITSLPNYPMKRWYDLGWWGDQGQTSQCVAYAWTHFVEDSPITHPETVSPASIWKPADLYADAQRLDEWPGSDYDGTSVRGGAKAVQARGRITSYAFGWDSNTLARWILQYGPAVAGTNWYSSMFQPIWRTDALGTRRLYLNIDPTSGIAGGHAFVINGVDVERRIFRMKNSWGRGWASEGRCSIDFTDMDVLLADDGEFCTTLEVAR